MEWADSADEPDPRTRLRPDVQRAGQRRRARARSRRGDRHDARRRARDRRRIARRDGRDRRPAGCRAAVARRAPPGEQAGNRQGLPRRLRARARNGGPARARDGLRLLARPAGRPAVDRDVRGGWGRPRARLAVGGRGWNGELGLRPASHLARRLPLRSHGARRRDP